MTTTHAREAHIPGLLRAHREGDPAAGRALFESLYAELRGMARKRLAGERANHTLGATSLVHEVYLRLEAAALPPLEREEFLRLAATVMRRILVDSARRNLLARRVDLAEFPPEERPREERLLRLDAALSELEHCDPPLARLVELRFLAGLGVEATAEALGVSPATVKRDWRTARAFLERRMAEGESDASEEGESDAP